MCMRSKTVSHNNKSAGDRPGCVIDIPFPPVPSLFLTPSPLRRALSAHALGVHNQFFYLPPSFFVCTEEKVLAKCDTTFVSIVKKNINLTLEMRLKFGVYLI